MVPLCILMCFLSEANMEALLSESIMVWELRHISFFILIIRFLFYTIVEKVIETFLSLNFLYLRRIIPLKIRNNIIK